MLVVCCLRLFRYGINADLFLVFAHSFETNDTVGQSEQRVVATLAYVRTGVNLRASLANENVSGKHRLTVATFCTESFGFTISSVVGRTRTFLMSE